MTWGELLIWIFIIGLLAGVVWLVVAVVGRLWVWLRSGLGRRRPARPRQPVRVVFGPARRAQVGTPGSEPPPAGSVEVDMQLSQPMQTRVVLGPARRVQVDTQALFGGPAVRRGAPLVIPAYHNPLWVEKGWQRNGSGYTGHYCAAGRQWRGLIREPYPGGFEVFIWSPPLRDLERRTKHRWCFRDGRSDGRHTVHFNRAPASLDHAITNIEAVLSEAMG